MRIDINRGDCSKEQSCYQRDESLRDKTLKQVTICSNTDKLINENQVF